MCVCVCVVYLGFVLLCNTSDDQIDIRLEYEYIFCSLNLTNMKQTYSFLYLDTWASHYFVLNDDQIDVRLEY